MAVVSTKITDAEAEALAATIKADEREAQIRKIADQLSTFCVIEQPTFFVALEALKHATMNLVVTMLLMPAIDDAAVLRRIDLATTEARDLYRLLAALERDIHTRGPHVALADLKSNITTLSAYLPNEVPHEHTRTN